MQVKPQVRERGCLELPINGMCLSVEQLSVSCTECRRARLCVRAALQIAWRTIAAQAFDLAPVLRTDSSASRTELMSFVGVVCAQMDSVSLVQRALHAQTHCARAAGAIAVSLLVHARRPLILSFGRASIVSACSCAVLLGLQFVRLAASHELCAKRVDPRRVHRAPRSAPRSVRCPGLSAAPLLTSSRLLVHAFGAQILCC